LNYKKRIYCYL